MATLVPTRTSIKGRITKFKNYIADLNAQESIFSKDVDELSLKLDRFRSMFTQFDQIQTQIEIATTSEMQTEIDIREEMENDFISLIATAQKIIDKAAEGSDFASVKSEVQSNCGHDNTCNGLNFRLPVIKIASFDGSYFKWLEFRDTFDSLIHSSDNIKPIHKFHYLNSYLDGEAAQVISNLEVSDSNYAEAWRLLCERYDNKKQLISNHLNSLFNLQAIGRESAKSLRYLVDHVSKNLRALNTLGQPTDKWDTLLIHMVASRLDSNTSLKWEEFKSNSFSNDDLPSLADFNRFLKGRADVLESVQRNKSDMKINITNNNNKREPIVSPHNKREKSSTKCFAVSATPAASASASPPACVFCSGEHRIYDCSSFLSLSIEDRISGASRLRLCLNCLRKGHTSHRCRVAPCHTCKKRHNILLHRETPQVATAPVDAPPPRSEPGLGLSSNMTVSRSNQVLLPTAYIDIYSPATNDYVTARAFLDCGSMTSIVTIDFKQRSQLAPLPSNTNLFGLSDVPISSNPERCFVQIRSKHDKNIKFDISCLALPVINSNLPLRPIDVSNVEWPRNKKLADPHFNQPGPVDILIGADVFWNLIGGEQIDLGHDTLVLRKSKLGWLVVSKYNAYSAFDEKSFNSFLQCNHLYTTSDNNLDDSLTKFWQLEQVPQPNQPFTDLEAECEQHFVTHTYRDDNGRFHVRLPLVTEPDCLGNSYRLAKKRFFALEKRFKRNPDLKAAYEQFINEYAELGHLSVSDSDIPDPSFFVPHHCVQKPSSESTKLRVVFHGSAPTTSGYSINDLQMVGPTIQDSLFNILLRFRTYKYVLTGDVAKMYRQVLVQECDRDLQLILWRSNENQPLKTLKLNTVTYGFSSASFLSTRCLWQLGEECANEKIKTIIQNDFLVDDLLTGSDTEEELCSIKESVERALAAGCFPLRKYRSNLSSILHDSENSENKGSLIISSSSHTLGVGWDSETDIIHFPTQYSAKDGHPTKRSILSDSCKIFDPLGLLCLLTIIPKVLIQKLWIEKIDWDAPVPSYINESWQDFVNGLASLTSIQIPRHVLCDSPTHIEMHVFCDASSVAYAACIYLKSTNEKGVVMVRLLCAKAKVTPVQATTIPRLELCACLLGAQLASAVSKTLRCQIAQKFYWTDSSIVIAWLKTNQTKLKTFVANRVAHILELTDGSEFRHVPTAVNPADYPSRGVEARRLPDLQMWWTGPSFLYEPQNNWPQFSSNSEFDLPELKVNVAITKDSQKNDVVDFDRYSKLKTLQRAVAYMLRFAHNCRLSTNKTTGVLQPEELEASFKKLVALSQQASFPLELKLLRDKQSLGPKCPILSLNPFYDEDDKLLRVGGRLSSSFYQFDKRHPMLLHAKHRFTRLLFQQEHIRLLHAPPQLLLAAIRESVWAVSGRTLARTVSQQCVTCRRVAGNTSAPLMGALPSQRVTPDFPFISVGVDFAGPFMITDRHGRGCKITKCYLAIFVCLRYKCLHLEAVSTLSTDSFILSLRRFISRRGRPCEIFCDNGRNFVGAAKEISDYLSSNSDTVCNFAANEGIQFKFQPAYAPHFGGLWEAGVKSAKFHLNRILGNGHLTYEELATLFSQVESILNSRPLCPLSSSPNDFQPLTPGHFIIGRALTSLPSPHLADINPSRLDRFQRLEALRQHFWRRWQMEYVCELQQRTKWRVPGRALQLGDLVLIKEENTPPLHWRLGRISKLFPGTDGISRVAEVATVTGTYKRGVKYLCPLLDETHEALKANASKGPQDVAAPTNEGEAGTAYQ
ncbi:uncharacterized protein LOC133519245 [Cydia pomonella]|uniref:uncharacterized protein LOC133519245 n=1 Tax=Cydia pomonella TaxID=82600 RepID=UPI002ADE4A19|nr:uncharacterized protein LOC133519245 [Cydia pomonella]